MNLAHYQILMAVHTARMMGERRGLYPSQIQARIDLVLTSEQLGRAICQLCDPTFHDDGPLLRLDRQRYVICGRDDSEGEEQTGGYRVLEQMRRNAHLPTREKEWVDRVRWPATQADSDLVPAAVPTGSSRTGYTGDPERVLGRTTTRARFAELHREGFRRCPTCKGWKQPEEFSANNRECRICQKLRARKRRIARGQQQPTQEQD